MPKQDRHANLTDLVRRNAINEDPLRTELALASRTGNNGNHDNGTRGKATRTDRIAKRGVVVYLWPQVHRELKAVAKGRGMTLQGLVTLELERLIKKKSQAVRRAATTRTAQGSAFQAEA